MNYKAKIIKNENGKYNIYVNTGIEEIPVGHVINEKIGIFEIVEWNTYEDAKEWIKSKGDKFELLEND